MHSEQNGTRPQGDGERPSLYALVIYLPDPLGAYLDNLRREMVPDCNPHAHVSVLPPRPLPVAPEAAIEEARGIVGSFAPFDIELGRIEKFDVTDVIYISVEDGAGQLRRMHETLTRGPLAYQEPFAYHPHVTLAQEIEEGHVASLAELAARRWREFQGPRRFRAESTVFVRNSQGNRWIDLADGPLRAAPVAPPGPG
jgi:2'-5' RNA ligase